MLQRIPGISGELRKAMEKEARYAHGFGGAGKGVRIESYVEQVNGEIDAKMGTRLKLAAQLVKDQVKRNINRPVLKYVGPRSGRIQVDPASRSKPGEYPKKETGNLQRSIFSELITRGRHGRFVGQKAVVFTTLGYGLLLEMHMDRSFLRRTMREMQPKVKRILLKKM